MPFQYNLGNIREYFSARYRARPNYGPPALKEIAENCSDFMNWLKLGLPPECQYLESAVAEMVHRHMVEFAARREKSQQWEMDLEALTFTVPQGIKFTLDSLDPMIFSETFVYDIHFTEFDLTGKVVVEAGGFVGDTALYYAGKGATVYTLEPDPYNFRKLLRNLSLNSTLSKNIIPVNAALGPDGSIEFPAGNGGGSSIYNHSESTAKVDSMSIDTLMEKYEIKNPYLLHLDVKGAEHDVLSGPGIGMFQRVRVEYSPYLSIQGSMIGDYPDWIKSALAGMGFDRIRIFKHNDFRKTLSEHGTVDAMKTG